MGLKKLFLAGVSLLIAVAIVFPVASQAALSGLDIMKKVDELPQGDDQKSTVTLRLISVQGQERKIVTSRYWKNYRDREDLMRMSIRSSERSHVTKKHATWWRVLLRRQELHTANGYSGY